MSTDGIQQQYIPASLDGLVYVDVDGLTVNGVPVDLDNLVPYTNATKNISLGTFNFETLGAVSAKEHVFPPFASTLMTGAMTSSIFTADAWGFANTISTVSLAPTVTASYLTLNNLTNNSTIVTFQNNGTANFGSTIVRTNRMASNVYDVVNLSTLQASVAFIENVNALNYVPYTNALQNLNMMGSTITTLGQINAGALRITSSIVNADYTLSVNTYDQLEFTNLSNGSIFKTNGADLFVTGSVSAGTLGATNVEAGSNIYLAKGSTAEWRTTLGMSDQYEILDNAGVMRLRLSKTTGLTVSTMNITQVPSATPTLALGVNGSGGVVSFAVPSGASFPFTGTTNINGGLQTLQNATQFNPTLDANSYFVTGVFPTTYTFTTNWTTNPVSGTTANVALDPVVFYFDTNHKYIISFTGIYGTGATWVGTVFNNSTSLTISDASIAITTSPQNLTMTFTAGSSNPAIYLRFVGASGTLRWTNFTIKEVDLQIMGNVALSSEIDSNVIQSNGRTANLANGLKVNQTSLATATSLTTASLPAGVSASTLSGSYTLTATAGGATFGMWLGSGFTYIAGAKYTFTFTGFSTNATATQAMILYTNTYSGGSGTSIGDYIVNVPIISSTVSGSFTATSNNNVVWNFVSSAAGRSISFSGFTLTRADTQITGVATLSTNTGTATSGLGLNASNQIVTTAVPVDFSAVSVGSVPYESATNTFSNSLITQGTTNFGYTGASFTASTGIASITFSSPTYTANSNASFQGIITLPALPTTALNLPCTATFTAVSFPFFAAAPYPYFTVTNGATVVYTSAVGVSGTVTIPFTPTSTTLFVTLYFKAPPTPQTAGIFTWTNFTITTPAMTTTGNHIITGNVGVGTTTPAYKLDVSGDARANGSLIIGSNGTYTPGCIFSNADWGIIMRALTASPTITKMLFTDASDTHLFGVDNNNRLYVGKTLSSAGTTRNSGIARLTVNSSYNDENTGFAINASDTGSATDNYTLKLFPYVVASGIVGYKFKTLNTATSYTPISFYRNLVGINTDQPNYNFDVNGTARVYNGNFRVYNGDDSMCYYGNNATWGALLVVGSGTNKVNYQQAQVITTNGNLHMDAGYGLDMYYGFYANQFGSPNSHRWYGTNYVFETIPQNTSPYSHVMCLDGNTLRRSQAVNKLVYFNNNVAWGGGVNMTYAFYVYNTTCSVYIWGKNSGYYTGGGMMQTTIRCYSQSSGTYYYFPINAYVNNGYNHFTVPLDYAYTFPYTGWYDIYVYSTSGWITDGNDQLTIGVTILPVSGF